LPDTTTTEVEESSLHASRKQRLDVSAVSEHSTTSSRSGVVEVRLIPTFS